MSPPVHAAPPAPTEPASSFAEQLRAVRQLAGFIWQRQPVDTRPRVVLSVVVIVLGQVVTVFAPLLLAAAINRIAADNGTSAGLMAAVFGLLAGHVGLKLLAALLPQLREFLFAPVGQGAERTAAVGVFAHLHTLSLRYHLDRRTGGLARIIDRGIRSIDYFFRFLLFNIGPTLLQLALATIAFGTRYSLLMAAIVLGTVIGYAGFTFASTEWRLKFRREMNEADQLANTRAVDGLLNYETVKYFNNEAYETTRYDEAIRRYQAAAIKSQESLAILNMGQAAILNIGLGISLALITQGIFAGTYGVGELTAVSLIILQLSQPLNILGFAYREIKQSLIDMEKMFALLRLTPEVTAVPAAPALRTGGGGIVFDRVSFAYDAERPILRDVSFAVGAGQKVAIVGPSGAGKSTIARLLYRFFDPGDGRILIDGQDIAKVSMASLQGAIGVVPQDTVLFNDTIGYNIAYGRPGAEAADIEAVARAAQIDGFIRALPRGYDTTVGERGLKLSGGEKQRVAIARTLLKDPPIMIFDEATSALDTATEQEILGALRRAAENRTTLVIAHRLSTIVDADVIVVLDQGRVVEQGNHAALLARGGVYADLWRRQADSVASAA